MATGSPSATVEVASPDPTSPPRGHEWAHLPLGVMLALVLDLAAPGAMSASLSLLGMAAGDGRLTTAAPAFVVYGWLLTMGVAQVPVLLPVVLLALLKRRFPCAVGLVLGGLVVCVANVVTALIVYPQIPLVTSTLEAWW